MAQLHKDFTFTGSLGNISAYKRRGSDKIILRTKGGASKSKIKRSPAFETTRKLNMEFGGRATASSWVLNALYALKHISDHSISGKINALLKPAQEMDTVSEFGKRHVLLSEQPRLLEGLSLNSKTLLESVVTNPVHYTLSKETMSASVDIPALRPGINFFVPGNFPLYRFTVLFDFIPDLFYTGHDYRPRTRSFAHVYGTGAATDWLSVNETSTPVKMDLKFDETPTDNAFSLMLAIGLEFGRYSQGTVEALKYVGAAKILAMG
jgi:hypothetical protein